MRSASPLSLATTTSIHVPTLLDAEGRKLEFLGRLRFVGATQMPSPVGTSFYHEGLFRVSPPGLSTGGCSP